MRIALQQGATWPIACRYLFSVRKHHYREWLFLKQVNDSPRELIAESIATTIKIDSLNFDNFDLVEN